VTPAQASKRNIANSISGYLATKLLTAGYVIHWYEQDAVETASGWWPDYEDQQAAYAVDATFSSDLAGSKGMVTLHGKLPANPVFVTRPTSSGAVQGQESIPLPCLAVEVGDASPVRPYELGSQVHDWARHLIVFGFTRDGLEQDLFGDWLGQWFLHRTYVTVQDHDAGSLTAVGDVMVGAQPIVESDQVLDGAEAATFVVELHARLEYVA
jgi:hypothetical protein